MRDEAATNRPRAIPIARLVRGEEDVPALRLRRVGRLVLDPLVVVAALGILAAIVALFELPALIRLPTGLLGALVLPGYALSQALIPGGLDRPERWTLSVGLSLGLVIIVAPLLDQTPWGLRAGPFVIVVSGVTLAAVAIAWRRRPPSSDRPSASQSDAPSDLSVAEAKPDAGLRLPAGAMVVILLVIAALVATLSLRPSAGTEFFMLGASGWADTYPTRIQLGQSVTVGLGIMNREDTLESFRVEAVSGSSQLTSLGPLSVDAGQRWTGSLTFTILRPGNDQEVQVNLFEEGQPEVYRSLRLWVDVVAGE